MKELLETLIRKANTKNGSGKTQDNQSPSESFFFFLNSRSLCKRKPGLCYDITSEIAIYIF